MSEELLAAAIQDAKEAEAYAKELEVENKALVEALEWQSDVIDKAITENEIGEHRLLLDGEYHKGPVVDWVHTALTGFSKINRAALAAAKEPTTARLVTVAEAAKVKRCIELILDEVGYDFDMLSTGCQTTLRALSHEGGK